MKILIYLYIIINFLISLSKCTILPTFYNVLGPFPIGEREETFDTLESYNSLGIFGIPIGDNTTYPSELGNKGVVGWSQYNTATPGSLEIDWPNIDWSFYDQSFGKEIYLWYAYAVGQFQAESTSNYIINCTNIRQYYVQTISNVPGVQNVIKEFTGDFYSYGNGQQLLQLESGQIYKLYIRMVSSTRMNQSPIGSFTCQLTEIPYYQPLTLIESESLLPDVVDSYLASPYGSITIMNTGVQDLSNITLVLSDASSSQFNLNVLNNMTDNSMFNILIGQRLSISFFIETKVNTTLIQCPSNLELSVISVNVSTIVLDSIIIPFNCTDFSNPFLFTFMDFDQTIQYAMATPPLNQCGLTQQLCNIILVTHDAGVEASSESWTNQFPRVDNLWILMPTGRTSWGYDWTSSSRLNVFNAIHSLATQIPGVPQSSKYLYKIDETKIVFLGSFGCWELLSHQGDLALGGACASGFPKLSLYLLYETAPGFSYIDQSLKAILMSSIEENNVDLISSNLVGLPLIARYGENDTIVNPYLSRRIVRMVCEQSQNETAIITSEEPNENHWFDGILNDQFMLNYYSHLVASNSFMPTIPKTITISTMNPASTGPRANIYILQLKTPYRLGKIKLTQIYEKNQLVWILETSNIRRFAIMPTPVRRQVPVELIIDGFPFNNNFFYPEYHFENIKDYTNKKSWTVSNDNATWIENERNPLTYGPIRQIFEKKFSIIYGTMGQSSSTQQFYDASIYLSNFWNTYGRGSAPIYSDIDYIPIYNKEECDENQNFILLGSSNENLFTDKLIQRSVVEFNTDNSFTLDKDYEFSMPGSGIAFIMPNSCGKGLILVIAGYDSHGFDNALHTIPKRSGEITGPDFIVAGPEFKSKGYGGILSAGYWSNNYTLSLSNFYTTLI